MIDWEFTIDFKSQLFIDTFITFSLYILSVVSVVIGFWFQQITYTIYSFGAGIILVLLVVLPAYPSYNKNQVEFLTVNYVQ